MFKLGELLDGFSNGTYSDEENINISAGSSAHCLIVSITGYLLGLPKERFGTSHEPTYDLDKFNELERKTVAQIIRNLCIIRTSVEHNFSKILKKMNTEYVSILSMPEYVPYDAIKFLDGKNLKVSSHLKNPADLLIEVNRLITSRINNCREFYPDWIQWDYVKALFLMPDGTSELGIKAAADTFYRNYNCYPFHIYLNWVFEPEVDTGNILYNDAKFVTLLYSQNNDEFRDMSKVSDVSERTKISIHDFIEEGENVVALVDCENSDPYSLVAAIDGMDVTTRSRIKKIVLFDDKNAATAWKRLQNYVDVPIEHNLITRLKEHKSLVDMSLAVQACRECFKNNVDRFLLISSDSDYWALIKALPEAEFLVMIEHEKSSFDLKGKLLEENIYYAYLDDFYSADSTRIRTGVLIAEMQEKLNEQLQLNLQDMLKETIEEARMNMSASEQKNFFEKYLGSAKMIVDRDGTCKVELKKA